MSTSISSAMRRTISVRCSTVTTSRRVTRSSTSRADRAARDLVEAVLVALEGLQRLVGPVEQPGDGLQRVLLVAHVDGDDRHVLGHRDHRHVDRAGHPLGGAVAGAGLGRGHVGVGHQVHVGPGDAAGVGGQDDGAVHLGQLGQALRAEGGVEQEAARADVEHLGTVAHDDQRAHLAPAGCGRGPHAAACPARRPRSASSSSALRRGAIGRSYLPIGAMPRAVRRRCRRPGGASSSRAAARSGAAGQLRPRRAWRPAGPSMPGARSGAQAGTTARRKPEPGGLGQARGPSGATWRSSPPRPTSPQADEVVGDGHARSATTRARGPGRGRRRARPTRTPPTARRTRRARAKSSPARCCRARRAAAPAGRRRGPAPTGAGVGMRDVGDERLHLDQQRPVPSRSGTTTEPADARAGGRRGTAPLGSGTPTSPASVISNRPSSSVEPKRCLTARSRRRAWWRSPSNDSTVSTTCSSTRGPASAAVLGDVADEHGGHAAVLRPPAPGGARTRAPGRPSPAPTRASGS